MSADTFVASFMWISPFAAVLLLWGSLRLRRRQRLLADLPTSKAAGVFIGLVEMKGAAECEAPCSSFLAGVACVHYAFSVEEQWSRTVTETYSDKEGKTQTRTRRESGWATVAKGGETVDFYVQDDTGSVLVRPSGAKFEPRSLCHKIVSQGAALYYAKGPATAVADSDHRRRFVEHGIPLHSPVFVVGQARERADVVAPEIAAREDSEIFLISTRSEEKIQSGYSAWSWVCLLIGLGVALGGLRLFEHRQLVAPAPGPYVAVGAGYLAAFAVGWVWMVYNSLVALRQRTRQGWSLIEVQLKRRHNLIPGLAAMCAGLSAHESGVQTLVATLRAQQEATPPGVAGPDYTGVAPELRAVIERYPALMARDGFSSLHRGLVETEQRVALARAYYNDIATSFATRLERVPDRWVAALGGMRPMALLGGENFERAPVPVKFA